MKNFLTIIFLLTCFHIAGQTIPINRICDWSHAGYPDSIPSPANILNVMNFGAVGDGITDDYNAIISAIDSLHGNRGVIYFPAGDFLVGSTIDLTDSVIVRGMSADSTHLIFNFNGVAGNGFNITGSGSGIFTPVIFGADRGSNSMVVINSATFSAGDYAELIENNGSWDSQPVFWADNSVGQILHLTNVIGDTLYFDSPLRINYNSSLNVRIQKIIPAVETGIECMRISRADSVSTGVCYNIYYNYAANCWIRGVESNVSVGSHIEADASTNISIRGCYIHHSFLYDGVSTHGYGITLFAHTGQCLIENNIMQHLRHSFNLQTGANGNVIAYNYSIDPNRSEVPSNFGADISLHGHYPYSNLFEGNIIQNIQIDSTHGPNGPFNTFFRNRAELYGIFMTTGPAHNDSMNFVGNEVTNTNIPYGNYIISGNGHFEFGNNIKGTITPAGTMPLPDSSYYLNGYPPFFTTFLFPSIGIPNAISTGSIPARDRFLSGINLTSCNDDITLAIKTTDNSRFDVYPNPTSQSVIIHQQISSKQFVISLKDFTGKTILIKKFSGMNDDCIFNFPDDLTNGVYLMRIDENEKSILKKIVLIR